MFNIGGKKDLPTWDWLARVVRHWTRMEEIISERGPGPWIFMLNENGVDEFNPKWLVDEAN